jgi:hypothetical protein
LSIFDLNQTPKRVSMTIVGNTGLFPSPLIASAQTIARSTKWNAGYIFTNMRDDDRADLLGTIAALRGQDNRLRVPVFDNSKRGAYGGTPLVNGAGQTGFSLNVKDASLSITNWIRKGDYFSVDVNGEHELKMATADADSDGAGLVVLSFAPRLRAAPLADAVLFVEDGVLTKPQGIFLLETADTTWQSSPGSPSKITSVSLAMTEDVFATQ